MGGFRLTKKSERVAAATAAAQPVTEGPREVREGGSGAASERPLARGTVRLSFDVSRDLHRRLKLEAVRRGETIVAMVSRWIAETTPAF